MEIGIIFFVLTFLGGILSFFSPCVVPLMPVYFGYLAGNGKKIDEEGNIVYEQKKVFINTLFFVLGISLSFFILGLSFTWLGEILFKGKETLTRLGGIIILLLGCFQLGIINLNFLQRERRLDYEGKKINPLVALLTGFTFGFAWTPCIGPILSSILILAAGTGSRITGNLLILVYSLGFIVPFLLLGVFTTKILNYLKSKQNLLKYTVKIGGIILVLMGTLTITGYTSQISNYFSSSSGLSGLVQIQEEVTKETSPISSESFKLIDQYGQEHILSDYKGKTIFLNFWATWCPPCREEMPHIQELYKEYGENKGDVIILGITNPKTEENPYGSDKSIDGIKKFLNSNSYSFPTVFDRTGLYFENYQIRAFPTTFIIGKDGEIKTAVPGAMNKAQMKQLIESSK